MFLLFFFCWFLCFLLPSDGKEQKTEVTVSDIERLRTEVRDLIDLSGAGEAAPTETFWPFGRSILGTIIRLNFHDCVGPKSGKKQNKKFAKAICDGCIDITLPDHKGFEDVIEALEDIYVISSYNEMMSRADFWATVGNLAIEYSVLLQNVNNFLPFLQPSPMPNVPYYFGRKDCKSVKGQQPWIGDEGNFVIPSANSGFTALAEFFKERFNFNVNETVAIMGAHSLGEAHKSVTGYMDTWDGGPAVIDSEYFFNFACEAVLGSEFPLCGSYIQQKVSDNEQSPSDERWQWVIGNPNFGSFNLFQRVLNLNVDMALWMDFEPYMDPVTGKVECTFLENQIPGKPQCPPQPLSRPKTLEFATDNQQFLIEFADVWERMLLAGYNKESLKKIISVPNDPPITGSTAP